MGTTVVRISAKLDEARAFRLLTVLRRLAEAADHQDELSVIELHGAMLAAALTYGTAEWDRLWSLAGLSGPADRVVVNRAMSSLREFVREAS